MCSFFLYLLHYCHLATCYSCTAFYCHLDEIKFDILNSTNDQNNVAGVNK